jgi:hypothetical protein
MYIIQVALFEILSVALSNPIKIYIIQVAVIIEEYTMKFWERVIKNRLKKLTFVSKN